MIDEPGPVGASLRQARESLGFSLSEWAEMINISKSYVGLIEQGKRPAPGYVIEAYDRVSRSVLMKRRTLIAALVAVPAATEELRDPGMAQQTLQYGLWLGDRGQLKEADRMYQAATVIADWTGHLPTQSYVRARIASRGVYEGWSKAKAMQAVSEALGLSSHRRTVVEANAALVEVHTLSGDYNSARSAGEEMQRASETDEDHIRTAVFINYLECMLGDPIKARAFYESHTTELRANRVWGYEALVYQGLALVRSGERDGVLAALEAVRSLGDDVRMVGMGVTHLLREVDFESPEVEELRTFARL